MYPKGCKSAIAGSGEAIYLWNAMAGISHEIPERTNAMDLGNDFGCLKNQRSHPSAKLMAQYDVVTMRYLATDTEAWRGRVIRGRLCRLFVSYGCTKFLEGCALCLAKGHGVDRSSLMQQAISALFFDSDAPSHMSIVLILLRDGYVWCESESIL